MEEKGPTLESDVVDLDEFPVPMDRREEEEEEPWNNDKHFFSGNKWEMMSFRCFTFLVRFSAGDVSHPSKKWKLCRAASVANFLLKS